MSCRSDKHLKKIENKILKLLVSKKSCQKTWKKAEVSHLYDMNKIMEYGVMMTPAVAIDGKIRIEGKIPREDEIEKIIKEII